MKTMLRSHAGLLLLGVVLVAIPAVTSNTFYLDLAVRIGLNALVAIGLNLLIGYAGQISLGHAGFLGIGAYASAVLTTHFGFAPVAALLSGALGSALLALLVARPILRLRGHYLAMATLGLGIIISIVIVNESAYTGGPDGIAVPPLAALGVELNGENAWYVVVALLLLFAAWGAGNLIDAPAGRALQAIHGSEIAARVAGIDVVAAKVKIFVVSAVIASVVGSLSAHYVGFVTPGQAGFMHSVELMTMVVLGGMASVFGSIVGAALLTLLPQLLSTLEGWETVVFGVILMLTMIYLPAGLVPSLRLRFARPPSAAKGEA
jgi:branched-chain amino acid transport system permease protein